MSYQVIIQEHWLKRELKKSKIPLWYVRKALGGSPSEATLYRFLSGIDEMPKELEKQIQEVVNEYRQPIVTCK